MKKQLSRIAILLVITMCLPLLAACDVSQFIGGQPTPPANDGKVEDKTEAKDDDVQDDELPKGMQMALGSDNNSYRVSSYKGTETNLVIPETYNGFPVTEIDENAFLGNKKLVSVVIPDSVEIIGDSAFKNCQKLETVTFGEYASMLCEIGKQAFFGCTTLEFIEFVGDEYTWNSVEKGKDWDKNAGMKTDDKKYEVVFIETSERPTEAPECAHEEVVIEGKAATCTEAGLTEGKKCAKCEEILVPQEEIPATGHTLDAGTPAENVACGEKATVTYKCENCDYTQTEEGAVVEHDLEESVGKAPTCTENGEKIVKCIREGCEYTEAIELDALGHTELILEPIAPTCTKNGLTAGIKCAECENMLIAQEVIEALGHMYIEVGYVAPTTAEVGYVAHIACEGCDAVWTTDGEATTLDAISIPVIVPASEKFFGVAELSKLTVSGVVGSKFAAPEISADRTYVRFARAGQSDDGNIMLLEGNTEVTGQYLVMKYRTDHMGYIEVWANTTENGHSSGKSKLGESTISDGEWHIAIMDLSKRLSGYVKADGEGKYTVQWSRIDIFNGKGTEGYFDLAWVIYCDDVNDIKFAMTEEDAAICPHIIAENAEYTDNGDYHYTTCLLCGGEAKYSHSISTEPVYDSEAKLYRGTCVCGKDMTSEMIYITEANTAQGGTNCVTVTQEDGFVRYAATKEGNKDLYMHIYTNGSVRTGKYMVITYRLVNNGKDASKRGIFAGSSSSANTSATGNGDHQNTSTGSAFIGDGEWHCMIIFPKETNTQFTDDTWKYLRIGYTPDAYDGSCYLDIAEIAFADSMVAAENYAMNHDEAPYYIGNIDKGNCSLNGEVITETVRGTSKPIALDLEGKTLNSADSLVLGGWCCVAGGISSYNIRVTSIDGEAVEAPELIKWGSTADRGDIYTAIGKAQGFSDACATGAGMNKSAVDLSAWAGHEINFEVVAISNYGAELVIVLVNNVTVPAA